MASKLLQVSVKIRPFCQELLTDPFLPTHKRHCVTGVAEVKVGGAAEEPAGEAESRWGAESIQYTNDTGVTGVAEVKVGDLHSPPGGGMRRPRGSV
jgi:hypothetical protein